MSRYLVVAHQTAGSPELREHVGHLATQDPEAEFTVLVPATPASHLFAWREEESLTIAQENLEQSSRLLREAGAQVMRTVIGSRFPVEAITDELRDSPGYDGIVICTFPPGISRWLKLDLITQAERRSGLPVTHVVARPSQAASQTRERAAVGAAATPGTRQGGSQERGEPEQAHPPEGSSYATPSSAVAEETIGELQLPHLEREDLPPESQELWDRLDEGRGVANIFRTMGHNRTLLHAYAEMLNALWNESGLDDQTRELAILRTALVLRSRYVWHHHARIARELAIPDDRITAIEHWGSSERVHFDERERAVLAYVDAVAHNKEPSRQIRDTLEQYYGPGALVGLTLLVGFYVMTAAFAGHCRWSRRNGSWGGGSTERSP